MCSDAVYESFYNSFSKVFTFVKLSLGEQGFQGWASAFDAHGWLYYCFTEFEHDWGGAVLGG